MQRLLALLLLLALAVAAGCGDDDEKKQPADDGSAPEPVPAQSQTVKQPAQQRDKYGCVAVAQPKQKPDGGEQKPTEPLSDDATVTFKTNCGTFKVTVSAEGGLTSASFVKLAKSGFYNNTIFHRIAPEFVIQGGDPTATGTGGPGYTTTDAPPSDAEYPKYTVAMAKGPQEPDGTAGSQFFVMTGDAGLPPQYALVGEVTSGFKVIDNIGTFGDPSEHPTRIVKIEKASATGG